MKRVDSEGWLGLHKFYPGVIARINQIMLQKTQLYIVTTKEGRFVTKLLQQEGIEMESRFIFGKECQRPKYQILQLILKTGKENSANLWFVEDRLKTLQLVKQQQDLQEVSLYPADWGYNTERDCLGVASDNQISLLSLEQFNRHFAAWQS